MFSIAVKVPYFLVTERRETPAAAVCLRLGWVAVESEATEFVAVETADFVLDRTMCIHDITIEESRTAIVLVEFKQGMQQYVGTLNAVVRSGVLGSGMADAGLARDKNHAHVGDLSHFLSVVTGAAR